MTYGLESLNEMCRNIDIFTLIGVSRELFTTVS
jgi:hypothetical protein